METSKFGPKISPINLGLALTGEKPYEMDKKVSINAPHRCSIICKHICIQYTSRSEKC